MKTYKSPDNSLHVIDPQFSFLLPFGSVEITEQEADSLRNKPETPEQTIARLDAALDSHLDAVANLYRYESIRTMVTYVGDPYPKFDAEGKAAKSWRSACYALSIEIMNAVVAGDRPVPTEAELLAEMPKITDYLVYQE